MASVEEVVQKLQRDLNCLLDDNRATRRRALDHLRKELVTGRHSPEAAQALMEVVLKPLLKVFSDQVEGCREQAVAMVTDLSATVPDVSLFLPLIMPVVVARLGTQEITEPSEELRLSLVSFLSSLVERCRAQTIPYLSDITCILQRTLVDPYPEVKKESSLCLIKVATSTTGSFQLHSDPLVKSLLASVTHQHSKVRATCLKALGVAIPRACDPIPSVRSCLAEVVGGWLLDMVDRYSYHHKLIPLLLTCMTDELPDIRSQTHTLWEKVGQKYEQENEDDLKDKMDFVKTVNAAPGLEFPRPRLGCRVLVYRNFSKILPALLRDLSDWTVNSRIRSSQLLHTLLYHLEDNITHHIQAILVGLYRACQDDEKTVVDQAFHCSELIGFYVSTEVWSSLVLPAVRSSAGCKAGGSHATSPVPVGPVQCTGCLMTLRGLIRGAPPSLLGPNLKAITECLAEPEVAQSQHVPLLRELLGCVKACIMAAGPSCSEHSLRLFSVLLMVSSSKLIGQLQTEVDAAMTMLASSQGMESVHVLYQVHSKDILNTLKDSYKSWTLHSPNCSLFASLLLGAGPVIGQLLDDIIPILTSCLHPDNDPEMKLQFITILIRLLMDASSTLDSQKHFSAFAVCVLKDIVLPNCVWKAGRASSAIRTASMSCVQAILQGTLITDGDLDSFKDSFLPQVVSCLDDDNSSTRLVSCKVLQLYLMRRPPLPMDRLHLLYGELLKRLDDSSDEIRVAVTKTLAAYISAFPDGYDCGLYSAHIEAIYRGLLIHLDDPSSEIQEAVTVVLKQASRLNPQLLVQLVESVKHKHRTTRYCDTLLSSVQQ
ncbi:hypothetical protein EMCRGX_G020494 [Ephydatia muelleri]